MLNVRCHSWVVSKYRLLAFPISSSLLLLERSGAHHRMTRTLTSTATARYMGRQRARMLGLLRLISYTTNKAKGMRKRLQYNVDSVKCLTQRFRQSALEYTTKNTENWLFVS